MAEAFLLKLDVHSQKILQSCVWVPEDHPFFISLDPSSTDVTIQKGRAPDITKPTSPSSVPGALSSALTFLKSPLLSDMVLSVGSSASSFRLNSWATEIIQELCALEPPSPRQIMHAQLSKCILKARPLLCAEFQTSITTSYSMVQARPLLCAELFSWDFDVSILLAIRGQPVQNPMVRMLSPSLAHNRPTLREQEKQH